VKILISTEWIHITLPGEYKGVDSPPPISDPLELIRIYSGGNLEGEIF
jgi:hypothetical protein